MALFVITRLFKVAVDVAEIVDVEKAPEMEPEAALKLPPITAFVPTEKDPVVLALAAANVVVI